MKNDLSRRAILGGSAAFALTALAGPALASAPMMGVSTSPYRRFKLGDFEVTTLLAGTRTVPDPQTIFGLNVSPSTFERASEQAHIPADKSQFFFTPTLVNTGSELFLFDTGLSPDGITTTLAAAGYRPEQVDVVVITHMHGDHIGGLRGDGGATFANARYVTGATEFDFWGPTGNERFEAKMRPFVETTSFVKDGDSIASGITAMAAFGHTPGHMAYLLESNGQTLLLAADFANHYVWSLAHPDWEVKFDRDKAAAAATRRRILSMLAAERMPFVGYHMPWPAVGYVETTGDGFRYVPQSYQLML